MKQASGISVVVTTWNKRELADKCISHLSERFAGHVGSWEIVLVDNGSIDGTAALIGKKHPTVRIIALPGNIGFGPAANLGIQGSKYPLVLLMNDDMELAPGFIGPMSRHFSDPAVFAVAPKMILNDDRRGGRTTAVFRRGLIEMKVAVDDRRNNLLVGGAGLFRRQHLLALGGFDPLFVPFYWEDSDLCFRAWRRGWRLLYEPKSEVFHNHGTTIRDRYRQKYVTAIVERNRLLFHWKNITDTNMMAKHIAFLVLRCLKQMLTLRFGELWPLVLALRQLQDIPVRRRRERVAAKSTEMDILAAVAAEEGRSCGS